MEKKDLFGLNATNTLNTPCPLSRMAAASCWRCFSSAETWRMGRVDGKMSGAKYRRSLESIKDFRLGRRVPFQQDNHITQDARATMDGLKQNICMG